jgi:cephalosporin hydroxylase
MEPLPNWSNDQTLATFHEGTFEVFAYGRKTQKCWQDLSRLQMGIGIAQPEVIIETGTRWGGSAGWLHETARNALVVSIDTNPLIGWTAKNYDTHNRNIQYVIGDSTDRHLYSVVAEWARGKRTMVILDSDHHAPHVLEEIRLYSELVTPGSFLVVEDGCFDTWYDEDARRGGAKIPEVGGPLAAIRTWNPEARGGWYRDTEIEGAFSVSHSPCGWWKKTQ